MRICNYACTIVLLGCLTLFLPLKADAAINVDKILVIKHEKHLLILRNGGVVREYKVALGRRQGAKHRQGDYRTPEGNYIIDGRSASSKFYKALHISYPNVHDLAAARKLSVNSGGNILIHGLPRGYEDLGGVHASRNWTKGCIAVSNDEMDEIWELVADGTPIQIVS